MGQGDSSDIMAIRLVFIIGYLCIVYVYSLPHSRSLFLPWSRGMTHFNTYFIALIHFPAWLGVFR